MHTRLVYDKSDNQKARMKKITRER